MKTRWIFILALGIATVLSFQNCSQTPFGALELGKQELSSELDASGEVNLVTNPVALLSAEQVFKSMASVTGVAPTGGITNEYNTRQALMASGYDVKLITAPMAMGIANLAGSYCLELVNREAGMAAGSRKFFSQIDFTKPIVSVTDANFESVVQTMSQSFYGRDLKAEELEILKTAKSEFVAALTDAEQKQQAAQTRNLMNFSCIGMLSSFEFLTF